jgi:hypothetical protein
LIVEAMGALPVTSATLDGEGVVVDDRGLTDLRRSSVTPARSARRASSRSDAIALTARAGAAIG